ncbi:MAG TPA: hypothetical protein VKA08_17600 [Balneolales bacterium]|nr:hypothetical protein [Balneolales bacterium]
MKTKSVFEKIYEVYDYTWNKTVSTIWTEWKEALERRDIRIQLGGLFVVITFYLWALPGFFRYIQQRQGIVLNDPILNHLPALDLSVYCFGILYISVISTILYLLVRPDRMIIGLIGYVLLLSLRLLTIYLIPLDPPSKIIPLEDPFIDNLFYANMHITKDLFFSGHVSTIFILYLSVESPRLRQFLLGGCVFIAVFLLFQHVHYTLDIVAAPLFAWAAYQSAEQIYQKMRQLFGQPREAVA